MKSYSLYEAVGLHLFKILSHSQSNDGYWAHVSFLPEGKKVLLITLRFVGYFADRSGEMCIIFVLIL